MDPITQLVAQQLPIAPGPDAFTRFAGPVINAVWGFAVTLVVGALLLALTPTFTGNAVDTVGKKPGVSFLWGLGLVVVLAVAAFAATYIPLDLAGIVAAFLIVIAILVVTLVGSVVVFVYVGGRLLAAAGIETSRGGHIVVGALVAAILGVVFGIVPFVGGIPTVLTNVVIGIFGAGAIAYRLRSGRDRTGPSPARAGTGLGPN